MHDNPQVLRHKPQPWLKPAGFAVAGLAVLVLAAGVLGRAKASQDLHVVSSDQAVPTVSVIHPAASDGEQSLTLPGNFQAFNDAQIHARVSGYLKHWFTDIGARVRAGQVLAEIDTPELDQQLAQALANLATARSNQTLARTTSARWAGLLADDAVSKQEAEERKADLSAKSSVVDAAQAEVRRLKALEAFKKIAAPFDGVVTSRTTDIGALIAAGNANDPGLFTIADDHRLRLYVRAPQSYSSQFHVGDMATVSVPEHPGRTFSAKLTSMTGAVSDQNGAMLIELQADNSGRDLKPGDYSQVHFVTKGQHGVLRLPSSALMFKHGGMAVATLSPSNRVEIRFVNIGRDLGAVVEISSGLIASDRVIDNPPDSLASGDPVRLAETGQARAVPAKEG
jgi:RND family efflux transporter MFP subunit